MTAVETLEAGLPCIVADTGGLREVVTDGRTGLLFPPGDAERLAVQMLRILSDRRLGKRLGESGRREAAKRFGWERIARRTAAVYAQVVGGAQLEHGRVIPADAEGGTETAWDRASA